MPVKATKLALLMAILLLLVGAAACGSGGPGEKGSENDSPPVVGQRVETDDGSYIDISSQDLQAMLEAKDFSFVNVHAPYEGEIEPTDLFIPPDEIEDRLGELPSDTDAKIVVYCRSGNMSTTAATTLVRLGYTNVWNVAGGMIAWEKAGYPMLASDGS